MWHTDTDFVDCPYCGERIELVVDPSVAEQSYIEDCSVCCRPITVHLSIADDGSTDLRAGRDDD